MDDNAWDMRYEVPGGEYGLFVARYILREEVGPPWIDPFALDVAYEDLRSVYIARPDVEKEVVGFGTRIVLGREGTGKTTLSSMWKHLLPPTTFVVRVPILELGTADREETLLAGQASLLTPELLIPCIWNAYWDDLLCNSRNRARFLPRLRQDRGWMRRLRCFYRRFPPLWPEIDGEFELMSWLRVVESDEILSPAMAPEAALCELLGLVAYAPLPAGRFSAPFIPPYRQVHLLIDGVEDLSPSGTSRLLRDLHRLYVLYRGSLDLTLFLDSGLEVQVKETDCVRQGRVTLCYLPRWQKGQLEEMLAQRITARRPAESSAPNLGLLIPESCLAPEARQLFTETIVDAALRAYDTDDMDAPPHLLRIARGLVAVCAWHWSRPATGRLEMAEIRERIDRYWS